MSEIKLTQREIQKIEDIAVDWVVREDNGLSPSEEKELQEWLLGSEVHRQAYDEQRWNWGEFDRLAGLHTSYGSSEDPHLLINDRKTKAPFYVNVWWQVLGGVAAVVTISFSLFDRFLDHKHEIEERNYAEVIVDRIDTQELNDGSTIQLNRGAEIQVAFSESERSVSLKAGEANFVVEKDESRPFIVEVSGVRLRAVGTEFNVRVDQTSLDVIVTEGVVAVSSKNEEFSQGRQATETYLEVNQRVFVDLEADVFDPKIQFLDEEIVQQELIWKPVLIDFEDVPLTQIIDEFNRRNPVKMVVIDGSAGDVRISSMFWSDNLNGFIRLLESNFDIRAEWGEDGSIYLLSGSHL